MGKECSAARTYGLLHLAEVGRPIGLPTTWDALEGESDAPPSRVPSLRPATVSLVASAGFNGICNRQ